MMTDTQRTTYESICRRLEREKVELQIELNQPKHLQCNGYIKETKVWINTLEEMKKELEE